MIDPQIKARIIQAREACQQHTPFSWKDASDQFEQKCPAMEAELAIEWRMYPDFAKRIQTFLRAAINMQVIDYTLVDQVGDHECGCWHGWLDDLNEHRAYKSSEKVRKELRISGLNPIESWLYRAHNMGHYPITLDNTAFVVLLCFLVEYYERTFAA